MLQLRALDTLGGGNRDWLKARHHFAVEAQGNPAHARLGNLVVWNDDEIAPHSGCPGQSPALPFRIYAVPVNKGQSQ